MLGPAGLRYLCDAFSARDLSDHATNDDELAAAMAIETPTPREPWWAGWFRRQETPAPETLDMAILRLGALSPHLLEDIGCEVLSKRQTVGIRTEPAPVVVVRLIDPAGPRAPRPVQIPGPAPAIAAA